MIGDNEVSVPTHLYKVVVAEEGGGGDARVASFVVPNKKIPREKILRDYESVYRNP